VNTPRVGNHQTNPLVEAGRDHALGQEVGQAAHQGKQTELAGVQGQGRRRRFLAVHAVDPRIDEHLGDGNG
jgi:hypothetical protein